MYIYIYIYRGREIHIYIYIYMIIYMCMYIYKLPSGGCRCAIINVLYGQTANENPRKSEFESQRILNVKGGLS